MTRRPQPRRGLSGSRPAFAAAAVALLVLSALLMAGPVFLPAFSCQSFDGPPSLGLWPHPMIVRPAACLFGSAYAFLWIGFAGLLVALGWAVARRCAALVIVSAAAVIAGAAWLFVAVGGPSLVERALRHLPGLP